VNFILAIVSTGTISVGKQSKRTTTFVSELQYNISEKENLGVKQKSLTLTIAKIKFTSSLWLIDNFGTVVRGTARPGTRETPGSLKA
jgi:hypothetical protein